MEIVKCFINYRVLLNLLNIALSSYCALFEYPVSIFGLIYIKGKELTYRTLRELRRDLFRRGAAR